MHAGEWVGMGVCVWVSGWAWVCDERAGEHGCVHAGEWVGMGVCVRVSRWAWVCVCVGVCGAWMCERVEHGCVHAGEWVGMGVCMRVSR